MPVHARRIDKRRRIHVDSDIQSATFAPTGQMRLGSGKLRVRLRTPLARDGIAPDRRCKEKFCFGTRTALRKNKKVPDTRLPTHTEREGKKTGGRRRKKTPTSFLISAKDHANGEYKRPSKKLYCSLVPFYAYFSCFFFFFARLVGLRHAIRL